MTMKENKALSFLYTFKCYKKKRKRTKKPFISLNDFFWWLSRNKRPKEPFCLSLDLFQYLKNKKEGKVTSPSISWFICPRDPAPR